MNYETKSRSALARYEPVRMHIEGLLIDYDSGDSSRFVELAANSRQVDISLRRCRSTQEAELLMRDHAFDIVYVDYWLGDGVSIPFVQTLASRTTIPCVMLTALDEPDIREIAFRAGAAAFLSKDGLSTHSIDALSLAVLHRRQ